MVDEKIEDFKERVDNGINQQGRFPANVIVQDDALNDGTISKSTNNRLNKIGTPTDSPTSFGVANKEHEYSDAGSKSRYFDIDLWAERNGIIQIPKPSKSEKNKGCDELPTSEKFTAGNYSQSPTCKDCNLTLNGTNDHSQCSGEVYYKEMKSKNTKNNHPTVKSIALMSWLIKLVSKEK